MPFLLLSGTAMLALTQAPAAKIDADPDLPRIFFNMVPDVCFGVVRGHLLDPSSAHQLLLEPAPSARAELASRYPTVLQWYKSARKPQSVLVGVGDAPERCHVVLTNTVKGPATFQFAEALLRSIGYHAFVDPRGRAVTIFGKHVPDGTMIIALMGLTDATDGAGPQVSIDVALRADGLSTPAGSASPPPR